VGAEIPTPRKSDVLILVCEDDVEALEVNFLRFSIVGLAHEVIASISPGLKFTKTSEASSMPEPDPDDS
jgi:hypothetical protein